MCADHNLQPSAAAALAATHQNGIEPINIQITIDIADIYDGALQVLKRVKPFWPINNVKFKVSRCLFHDLGWDIISETVIRPALCV